MTVFKQLLNDYKQCLLRGDHSDGAAAYLAIVAEHEKAARRAQAAPAPQVTPEMIEAALEAYMPFGDMELAIQCALSAAPQPPEEESKVSQGHFDAVTEHIPGPAIWEQFADLFAAQCENRSHSLCKDGSHSAANEASKCATTIRMPNEYWRAKLVALQGQLLSSHGIKENE